MRLILLPRVLATIGRGERDEVLAHAMETLVACDRPRSGRERLRERLRFWPHRVDVPGLQTELLAGLFPHWAGLTGEQRKVVLGRPTWQLKEALESELRTDPLSVARWLEGHPIEQLAEVAARLMNQEDRDVSRCSARALFRMLVSAFGIEPSPVFGELIPEQERGADVGLSAQAQAGVVQAVREGLSRFGEHHQRDVILAAFLLADTLESPGSAALGLPELLSQDGHPAAAGMRAALRRTHAPFMRSRAWRWMKCEALAAAAIDRVGRGHGAMEHELVLSAGYLVLHPARRSGLGSVKVGLKATAGGPIPTEGGALPSPAELASLSQCSRRWVGEMAEAMQVDRSVRSVLRASMLSDRSAWVRHAYARSGDPVEQADFAFDGDGRVARTACLGRSAAGARRWSRWPMRSSDAERARLAGKLSSSSHAAVRWIARQDAARLSPWLVDQAESRLAAREWLAGDRAGFLGALRERMRGETVRERVDAIRLARLLRLTRGVEPELIELVESDEARVAATAVAALGEAGSESARAGIDRSLRAEDDRVRANAVEAGMRWAQRGEQAGALLDGRMYGAMIEAKCDPHHRVRANALRGLIEHTGVDRAGALLDSAGTDGLREMLEDDRSMHRLAGLWLAERTMSGPGRARAGAGWDWMCRRVAGLARRDEDEAVRTRAVRCARRLLAGMRGDGGVVRPRAAA
ncbi:MAG: hypothetical protein DYG94_02460 [Leptolyngbya sp. PLA3]|nr:MAG: hypothetical protein EDM82_02095 [Cyanobacteria bacterium CYA]MCE7967592.1 hypothetical protein [Leptolyngbya sp. PL-A3]